MTGPTDMMLESVCHGSDGRPVQTCLTVQPQLFQHHLPVGYKSSFSDISDYGANYNDKAFRRNMRWSTRVNFRKLIDSSTGYSDLFKHSEEADPKVDFKRADPVHTDAEFHSLDCFTTCRAISARQAYIYTPNSGSRFALFDQE